MLASGFADILRHPDEVTQQALVWQPTPLHLRRAADERMGLFIAHADGCIGRLVGSLPSAILG
jgi:hypothetical protein